MATFILVHGSFHGSWCWERLTPMLQTLGHLVIAPDLPASGADQTPIAQANLTRYVARICQIVDTQAEPPILVGHSMGAIVCAQVAELRADKIAAVVFVCGLLFRSGETLVGFLNEFAHLGIEDLVLANMKLCDDGKIATFPAHAAPKVFYHRCAEADAAWAASKLRPQATAVYAEPTSLSAAGFGSVRRFYVLGLDDRAVAPEFQRLMLERTPCEQVFEIDSDHSPFLSAPVKLASRLNIVANSVAQAAAV